MARLCNPYLHQWKLHILSRRLGSCRIDHVLDSRIAWTDDIFAVPIQRTYWRNLRRQYLRWQRLLVD